MAEKKKRLRPTQLHFYVNDQELDLINQMKRIGNSIFVEREALEQLLSDEKRDSFPLDI